VIVKKLEIEIEKDIRKKKKKSETKKQNKTNMASSVTSLDLNELLTYFWHFHENNKRTDPKVRNEPILFII